jgi:hypothetical protein
MAEEVTYRRHSRSFTLQFDGERVAESVGVNSLIDLDFAREPWQQMAHVALIDVATLQGAEDRSTAVDPPLPAYLEPAGKERGRSDIDADDSTLSPLPCCTTIVPESRLMSFGRRAKTSPIRSPLRHATAIIARFRMPVGARCEQALSRCSISFAVRRSASSRRNFPATRPRL